MRKIEIIDVGPRDGLQNEKVLFSTQDKISLISKLEAAGIKRYEATSFVHPKLVPQMADAEEVMAGLAPNPDVTRIGLALNLRGYTRARDAGVDEVNGVLTASDGFGVKNQGADRNKQLDILAEMAHAARADGMPLTVTISTAFGCPFDGDVPPADVARMAKAAAEMGIVEIAIADTIGAGTPWAVTEVIKAVRAVAPQAQLRAHFHDTRNTGLANAYAAVEAGVDILDASVGGMGGCPFAPAATGNIATEDLVHMLHRAGFETGLDLEALIETAHWLKTPLGRPVPSKLSKAGVFSGQARVAPKAAPQTAQ